MSLRNQGRANERKGTDQGQVAWREAEQRLASLGGFEGSGARLRVTYILFPDLPGEYSMCEHENPSGVS